MTILIQHLQRYYEDVGGMFVDVTQNLTEFECLGVT